MEDKAAHFLSVGILLILYLAVSLAFSEAQSEGVYANSVSYPCDLSS